MDSVWTTTVLLVPCVVVLTAGFFYVYGLVLSLLSKTSVRNKVVVLTDALSGLGKGQHSTNETIARGRGLKSVQRAGPVKSELIQM